MPTAGDIISEASAQLHGWGSTQDRITPLTTTIGPTDTSFTVDFAFGQSVGITPGVVEINSEQLYVIAVDQVTGTCTLANGFGRGYNGTTATSHAPGSIIISRPKFPRMWLFKQMNEIIADIYPDLFMIGKWQGVITYPSDTYVISASVPIDVLDVQWQDPIGNWHRHFSYDIDPYDGTFRLGSGGMIGRPLRVIYTQPPGQFVAETDDYATVTGLPLSCVDVLTLGIVAKQAPGLDISRAQLSSVEQSDRSRVVPPSAGVTVAKYLMAEYQQRLKNEAQSLRNQFKPRIRRVFT